MQLWCHAWRYFRKMQHPFFKIIERLPFPGNYFSRLNFGHVGVDILFGLWLRIDWLQNSWQVVMKKISEWGCQIFEIGIKSISSMSKIVPFAFDEQELVQSVAAWNSSSFLRKIECNPMGTFFLCIRDAKYGIPKYGMPWYKYVHCQWLHCYDRTLRAFVPFTHAEQQPYWTGMKMRSAPQRT